MPEEFEGEFDWDVFLSHCTHDKPLVRGIAERLRDRGLNVWFDEESIVPGDHIYGKIEAGIQRSRVLIFFASESSLSSEWVKLERWSASFRDPTNKLRRLITIRLDQTPLPDVLSAYANIDWNADKSPDHAFQRLLNACLVTRKPSQGNLTYQQVFTPGSPPTLPDLLVGRADLLDELCNLLQSPGIHPIVVGERGIGKTSLVQTAIQRIQSARTSTIEVNTVESFDECCKHICDDLSIPYDKGILTPASFLRVLKQSNVSAVVSVDELDDLPANSPIVRAFAKFAKAASNRANDLRVKFIFSGIGSNAHDVFKGHLSSERNLPQIRLGEIEPEDLRKFLSRVSALLQTNIPQHIESAMITEADGFPYYMHQVGFHMFAAFSRDSLAKTLSDTHLVEGRKRALSAAFSHYLRRYKFSIYQLSDLERLTLDCFLRSERRRIPVTELQELTALRASATKEDVLGAMRTLYTKDYLLFRRGDDTIALKDALLKPFLREKLGIVRPKSASKRPATLPDSQMNLL